MIYIFDVSIWHRQKVIGQRVNVLEDGHVFVLPTGFCLAFSRHDCTKETRVNHSRSKFGSYIASERHGIHTQKLSSNE